MPNDLLKLIVIGDTNVGKSCLVVRYTEAIFLQNTRNTIGVDFKLKTIYDDKVSPCSWDLCVATRFRLILLRLTLLSITTHALHFILSRARR